MRQKQVADTRAMAGRPPPSWRPWLEGNWEEVEVTYAEARRKLGTGGGRFRIRAVVHLGALLPADVQVECGVRGGERGHSASAVRLWSTQSYGNGAFVYEGTITDDAMGDIAPADLVVHVHPAHGDATQSSAAPVVAAVRPEGSGSAPLEGARSIEQAMGKFASESRAV